MYISPKTFAQIHSLICSNYIFTPVAGNKEACYGWFIELIWTELPWTKMADIQIMYYQSKQLAVRWMGMLTGIIINLPDKRTANLRTDAKTYHPFIPPDSELISHQIYSLI